MKVVVVGGGTAGYVAAVHISQTLPEAELIHVYASSIPKIGVGEGTTPRFPSWLKETIGLSNAEVMSACRGTLKKGTVFDGWGSEGRRFHNRFHPTYLEGCHFSADLIVDFLADYVRGRYIDAVVEGFEVRGDGAAVLLADGTRIDCDFVIDASGFPLATRHKSFDQGSDLLHLRWIPTGRALLRPLPGGLISGVTRAAARPHGWIFQIPLQGSTSCGYIFNPDLNTDAEIEADFDAFLADEGIAPTMTLRALSFPNFLRQTQFDGRVFSVGNAASFLEPLEATAIGATIFQVSAAKRIIEESVTGTPVSPAQIFVHNAVMRNYVLRNSLFIAWHYACGSEWDTPFWRHAARGLEFARKDPLVAPHLEAMAEFVGSAKAVPGQFVSDYTDVEGWKQDVFPLMTRYTPFGNFSELNFAQVGHGIGYYGPGLATNSLEPLGTG
jgi:tryptophan halogenase